MTPLCVAGCGRLELEAAHLAVSVALLQVVDKSSEVKPLLLDLDRYGGPDSLGMFPLFLKRTADVMTPRLSVVFRRLVRLGSSRLAGDRPMTRQF